MCCRFHNLAGSSAELGWLNMPWGGVRESLYRDVMLSSPNGSAYQLNPIPAWSSPNTMYPRNMGGYFLFAEALSRGFNPNLVPCVNATGTGVMPCPPSPAPRTELSCTVIQLARNRGSFWAAQQGGLPPSAPFRHFAAHFARSPRLKTRL